MTTAFDRRLSAAETAAAKAAPDPEAEWLDYLTVQELTDLDELLFNAGAHTFDDLSEADQMRAQAIALQAFARMAEGAEKP